MRVDLYRLVEDAGGDGVGEFAAQTGGVEFADDAVLMCSTSGACTPVSELEATVRFLKPMLASTSITILTV